MTVEDFVTEYNYMLSGAEPQTDDVLAELQSSVAAMFFVNCGVVPNFVFINNKAQIEIIRPELG